MKPIKFPEMNFTYAEDQPEYLPLPVLRWDNPEVSVTSCWQLTWKERLRVLFTGRLWFTQMTFGASLQPQLPTVEKPFRILEPEDEPITEA